MTANRINWRDLAHWVVLIAVAVTGVSGFLWRGLELDDSLIYARYIQNLISGNGFVYNPGEFVNGLTSPLFAYLAAVPSLLAGDARYGTMLVSIVAAAGTLLVFYRLMTRFVSERWIASLGALLAAANSMTYINLGMEASLFTLAVGLCFYLYFRDRFFWLGLCTGLAILVRPEAVFLVPAMALTTALFRRDWPGLQCYILPILLLSSQLLFNSLYFDALLPTSGLAKISQGATGHWGDHSFLFNLPRLFLWGFTFPDPGYSWSQSLIPVALIVVALPGLLVWQARQYLVLSWVFLALYTGFFATLNIPPQWWYCAIYFTLFCTWVVLGIDWLYGQLKTRRRQETFRTLLISLLVVLLVWQRGTDAGPDGRLERRDYRQMGLWIAANTPSDASLAAAEIGTLGWYSRRHIIDILGLVTEGNADLVATGDYQGWLALHPPDYILASEPPRFFESAVTLLRANHPQQLVEVTGFGFPGYRLYRYVPRYSE